MTIRCTDPGVYNQAVRSELEEAVERVVESGQYILGAELESFEREFAAFSGAAHCVGVGSGFDALVLGLRALGVGVGDEVVVPAHTFVATWLAVSAVGAVPVGVEPDDATFLMDPDALEGARTPRTRAVVPVHLHGHPAAMDRVCDWARAHDIRVVGDAAQAHGARLGGRGVGGFGDAAAFSFYPTKNLGALGDGGAITTDDPELAARLRRLRNYGVGASPGQSEVVGVNSRLDELQAALLRVKLRSLEEWNDARRAQADHYRNSLADLELRLQVPSTEAVAVWHHFVMRCANREQVRRRLSECGVETLVHYPVPPFEQPAYARSGFEPGAFPVARRLAAEVVSLPIGLHVSVDDQNTVVEVLHEAVGAG